MSRRIALVQGHPDPAGGHFCHALADAYAAGALAGGHAVRLVDVARLAFPVLRTREAYEDDPVPDDIAIAQDALRWCDHLLLVHPLWLGGPPALLKAFLEQTLRPGFAHDVGPAGWKRLLAGRSARLVVTMGMPAPVFRLYFGAHGVKSLERSILGFSGFRPIRRDLVGSVAGTNRGVHERWLRHLAARGRTGD